MTVSSCRRALAVLLGTLVTVGASASPTVQPRLAVRITADTNVFLQDEAPLAAGQTTAALPARVEALAFSATPGFDLGWKAASGAKVDFGYGAEIVRFTRFTAESHTDHRLSFAAAGAAGDARYEVKASALLTDGAHESVVFNRLGGAPCIGGEPVRARRAQDIFKLNATVTSAVPIGFIRTAATVFRQDFHTAERATPGYANYVDRDETTAGLDLGWKLSPTVTLVTGARAGHQGQADLLGKRLNYSNSLLRWLVGAEGSAGKTWKFSGVAGPDARRYGSAVAAGYRRERTSVFAEGSVAWTPRPEDSVTLSGKRYAWVAGGGRGAYFDLLCDVAWKHRFNPSWSGIAGLNHHNGNSRSCSTTAPRDEDIDAMRLGLTRTVASWQLEGLWQHEWSRSSVPQTPGRVYRREQFSLGASRAW